MCIKDNNNRQINKAFRYRFRDYVLSILHSFHLQCDFGMNYIYQYVILNAIRFKAKLCNHNDKRKFNRVLIGTHHNCSNLNYDLCCFLFSTQLWCWRWKCTTLFFRMHVLNTTLKHLIRALRFIPIYTSDVILNGCTTYSNERNKCIITAVLAFTMSVFIMKTCLYNFDPLKPHFYIVKLGFTGVYIIFLISAQKHRLWVLVRTASPRRF